MSDIPKIDLDSLSAREVKTLAENLRRAGSAKLAAQLDDILARRMGVAAPNALAASQRRATRSALIGSLGLAIVGGAVATIVLRWPFGSPADHAPAASFDAPLAHVVDPRLNMALATNAVVAPQAHRKIISATAKRAGDVTLERPPSEGDLRGAVPPAEPPFPTRSGSADLRLDLGALASATTADRDATVPRLDLGATRLAMAASAPRRASGCRRLTPAAQVICEDADQVAQDQRFAHPLVTDVRADIPRVNTPH